MNPSLAPPRIVSHAEILIFGIGQECKEAGAATIPQQWERLRPHIDHIPGQVGNAAYGVISNFPDGKGFLYVAGVEVSEFPPEPADFTRFRIPPQTYAIFHHADHLSGVLATWQAIYKHGLRDAGYKGLPGSSLERYGPEFSAETGLGGFEIWIPVASLSHQVKLARAMIFVKDIERMRAFYQDTLGLRPIEATRLSNYIEFESGFSLHAIPAEIAANIEICSPPQARETSAVKLTFETPNLAETQALLRSLSVPSIARAWGATDWLDPEGNVFGLTS